MECFQAIFEFHFCYVYLLEILDDFLSLVGYWLSGSLIHRSCWEEYKMDLLIVTNPHKSASKVSLRMSLEMFLGFQIKNGI